MSLRASLEKAFSPDTAMSHSLGTGLSAGQCAATAAIVFDRLGGSLVSTTIENESHWFNRIQVGDAVVDVDLTGDQFGRPAVQISMEGTLYSGTRIREVENLNNETIQRAIKLASRAGIQVSYMKQER